MRASSLLDNNTSAIHETPPATTGNSTENVTDLNAASALISLTSLSRGHRTSLAAEIYEGTDAVVNNEPSDESAIDPNTMVDHGFASIALSDPIFMLAAFGGVAWDMLVRQRLAGNRPRIGAWSQRMRRRLNVLTRANHLTPQSVCASISSSTPCVLSAGNAWPCSGIPRGIAMLARGAEQSRISFGGWGGSLRLFIDRRHATRERFVPESHELAG